MLYTFCCFDKPEAVGLRAANREAHLAFLSELGDRLFPAGPFLSEDGPAMVGSLIIVDCEGHGCRPRSGGPRPLCEDWSFLERCYQAVAEGFPQVVAGAQREY